MCPSLGLNSLPTNTSHNIGKVYKKINEICKLKSKKRVLPNKIVDEIDSHIEDPQYIAESFNDYFARIGHKMAESISEPPQKLPISQLHTYSENSFFYVSIIN